MALTTVSAPTHYGRVKRSLFSLGVKAYQNPQSVKGKLYSAGAEVTGLMLAPLNPYYDWGGIRREVQVALGQEDGQIGLNLPTRTLTEEQLKRGFHEKFVSGSFELKRFHSAWHNLRHYLLQPAVPLRELGLMVSAALIAIPSSLALALSKDHLPKQGIAIGVFGIIFSRMLFQTVSRGQKILKPLIDYLGRLDVETLSVQVKARSLTQIERICLLNELRAHKVDDRHFSVLDKIRVEGNEER